MMQPSPIMYYLQCLLGLFPSLTAQNKNGGDERRDDAGEDHRRAGAALPPCAGLGVSALPAGGTCS